MHRALIAVITMLALSPASAQAQVIERVVARIDGRPIWATELMERARVDNVEVGGYAELLTRMIDERLLAREARAQSVRVTTEEVDRAIEAVRTQNGIPDQEAFLAALEAQGVDYGHYLTEMRAQLVRLKLLQFVRVEESPETPASEEDWDAVERRLLARLRARAVIQRRL